MSDLSTVNVVVSDAEKERILREEATWTGPRLAMLAAAVLAIVLVTLYFLADNSIPDPHPHPYLPWRSP